MLSASHPEVLANRILFGEILAREGFVDHRDLPGIWRILNTNRAALQHPGAQRLEVANATNNPASPPRIDSRTLSDRACSRSRLSFARSCGDVSG